MTKQNIQSISVRLTSHSQYFDREILMKHGYTKLGYNEFGYSVQIFKCQKNIYYTNQPGYNELIWPVPSCSL